MEWTEIRAAYVAGEGSLRELAARFGVSPAAVQSRCRREKWKEQRDAAAKAEAASKAGKARRRRAEEFEKLIDEEERMEALIAEAQVQVLAALTKPPMKGRIEIGREMAYLAQAIETCARVRRDLLERPDQPERARQSIARAKIRLERERNRMAERAENAATGTINVTVVGVDGAEEYGG